MFFAALTSRSCRAPQAHVHERTCSGFGPVTVPQVEHNWDEGNQRSITTTLRPYQSALYSTIDRNSFHAASAMLRLSPALYRPPADAMPLTDRSSITTVWFSRTSRVESLCRWS